MATHARISPREAADRLAIRDLIDAYAHCADRRDAKGQMALFTEDIRFIVFMDATIAEPRAAAAIGRPHALTRRSPDPGDAGSPTRP
jgi:ketosteroid isomerase-like protein